MEISLLLAQQILQLFLILLMGYAVVRCGLLKAADSRVLSVVMVYLALPCVVLKAFQIDDSPALRTGLLYAFAIAVLLHLLFLALTAVLKRPLQLDVIEGATLIYSNAAALVIPLVRALLGEEYVVYSCAFVIVQLILLWTHCSTSLQGGGAIEWKKILLNVNLISIVMGAVLFFAHIPLPGQLLGALNQAVLPAGGPAAHRLPGGGAGGAAAAERGGLGAGRPLHFDDGVSGSHYPGLRHPYLHGAAVPPQCGPEQRAVCAVHAAVHCYHAGDDRPVCAGLPGVRAAGKALPPR